MTAVSLGVGLLLVLGAGCAGDEPEADAPPSSTIAEPAVTTTTQPAETSTSTSTTVAPTIPDEGPLTVDTATSTLEALMTAYRDALATIRADGALDERALRTFVDVYTVEAAQRSLDAFESRGGVSIIVPDGEVPTVSDVEVLESTETCTQVTVRIEGLKDLVTVPIALVQPYSVRLVRAPDGSSGPPWRIDFLSWHPDGVAIPESACP